MADPTTELLNFTANGTSYALLVPPVVLGAVMGALIAGLTSWLNTKSSRKQFAQQLTHEKTQAQHEREHEKNQDATSAKLGLRRDVYLQATAWATDGLKQLGVMINPETIVAWTLINPDAPARILLVGSKQTVERCMAVQCAFIKILRDFSLRRAGLLGAHKRMIQLGEKLMAVNASSSEPEIDAVLAEQQKLIATHIPNLQALAFDLTSHIEPAVELVAELQISMSKDLGFEPDEEAIRAAVREYNSVGRSSAEAVFKQIVDAVKKEVVA